jgi:5-methylcytosine-specific restriction endonuclease McrA
MVGDKDRVPMESPGESKENGAEIAEDQEDDSPLDVPSERRKLFIEKADRSVFELHRRFQHGDLILQPSFQRYSVWDSKKNSKLVESILLDVPIPVIYLAENSQGKFDVIDGQQRLNALFTFLNGGQLHGVRGYQWTGKLSGLTVLVELNGKLFKDLEKPLQLKFENGVIRVIEFKKESDEDVRFEVFERLNTGSVKLNDQELRNCVYRGPLNDLIKELAENPEFLKMLGREEPHPRMKDRELVLRFLALNESTHLKYTGKMKVFLNRYMERNRNISSKDQVMLRDAFHHSVALSYSVFGQEAFRRFVMGNDQNHDGEWETRKINNGLYDIVMCGWSYYAAPQIQRNSDSIREELVHLMTEDVDFIHSIEVSTDTKENIQMRFEKWLASLKAICGRPVDEPRAFTLAFKRKLWDADQTCMICGQRIHEIDDAHVDHIEHYWRGGMTIPDNARLTHRYCNLARGGRY